MKNIYRKSVLVATMFFVATGVCLGQNATTVQDTLLSVINEFTKTSVLLTKNEKNELQRLRDRKDDKKKFLFISYGNKKEYEVTICNEKVKLSPSKIRDLLEKNGKLEKKILDRYKLKDLANNWNDTAVSTFTHILVASQKIGAMIFVEKDTAKSKYADFLQSSLKDYSKLMPIYKDEQFTISKFDENYSGSFDYVDVLDILLDNNFSGGYGEYVKSDISAVVTTHRKDDKGLYIAVGSFDNRLKKDFECQSAEDFQILYYLWGLYASKKINSSDKNFYIASFDGFSYTEKHSAIYNIKKDFKTTISGQGVFPFFSYNSKNNLENTNSQKETIEKNNYDYFLKNVKFDTIPSPNGIIEKWKNFESKNKVLLQTKEEIAKYGEIFCTVTFGPVPDTAFIESYPELDEDCYKKNFLDSSLRNAIKLSIVRNVESQSHKNYREIEIKISVKDDYFKSATEEITIDTFPIVLRYEKTIDKTLHLDRTYHVKLAIKSNPVLSANSNQICFSNNTATIPIRIEHSKDEIIDSEFTPRIEITDTAVNTNLKQFIQGKKTSIKNSKDGNQDKFEIKMDFSGVDNEEMRKFFRQNKEAVKELQLKFKINFKTVSKDKKKYSYERFTPEFTLLADSSWWDRTKRIEDLEKLLKQDISTWYCDSLHNDTSEINFDRKRKELKINNSTFDIRDSFKIERVINNCYYYSIGDKNEKPFLRDGITSNIRNRIKDNLTNWYLLVEDE